MSMAIGVDSGSGNDETVVEVHGGCAKCHRTWPQTIFREMARAIANGGEVAEVICDPCIVASNSREGQVAEKIDEAQSGGGAVLVRQVMVTGIKSGTKVTGFRYPTHVRRDALIVTDLVVTFENGSEYLYENVPVVVCEAWMGASSFGTYFIQQIKHSYGCKKVN